MRLTGLPLMCHVLLVPMLALNPNSTLPRLEAVFGWAKHQPQYIFQYQNLQLCIFGEYVKITFFFAFR